MRFEAHRRDWQSTEPGIRLLAVTDSSRARGQGSVEEFRRVLYVACILGASYSTFVNGKFSQMEQARCGLATKLKVQTREQDHGCPARGN